MARITLEEVERIAALARLSLSAEESSRMTTELGAMLDYVEQLAGLDTREVEPTSHVLPLATPLREDQPEPGLPPDVAMANAPASEGTAFLVPKVIDGEEEG